MVILVLVIPLVVVKVKVEVLDQELEWVPGEHICTHHNTTHKISTQNSYSIFSCRCLNNFCNSPLKFPTKTFLMYFASSDHMDTEYNLHFPNSLN